MLLLWHPRQTNGTQAGHRASTGLVQCDPWSSLTVSSLAERPTARSSISDKPIGRPLFVSIQGRWRQERSFKGEPRTRGNNSPVRSRMIASGMDENSAEVTILKASLAKAKRNAQAQLPCRDRSSRICRSSSEAFAHDKLRKEFEIELAEGQARLQRQASFSRTVLRVCWGA